MPPNKEYSPANLPEGLRRQFEDVERRLWRVETAAAILGMAASLFFSLLAVFVSDRLWNTPAWLRVLIVAGGIGGALWEALPWARHRVWQRRDLRALAGLVQKKYRRLGDRLLGIVELANEEKHPANFSPALYQAAIRQVADESQKFDFLQSVSVDAAKRFAWMAGGLAAVLLAVAVVFPQAGWNAFLRWVRPGADIGRFTLVTLDGIPSELVVPHGEPFEIAGTVRYRSFWKPSRVSARFGSRSSAEASVQSGKFLLQIPAQFENGLLLVCLGDAAAPVHVLPNHRPSLQSLAAQIHLPDYLGQPDQSQAAQNGSLRAVEGSRLSFRGTISRPLAAAQMQGAGADAALAVQGPEFSSQAAEPSGAGQFIFNWRDNLGLTNAAPWRLTVQTEPDAPPVPDLPDLPRSVAMLASDVLHIRAEAGDDFGVRDLGLDWDVTSETPQTWSITTETKIQTDDTGQKKLEKTFLWSPAMNRIPADSTVELQGFARDYLPDRARVRTAAHVIRVLSAEEHAEMVRADLEALMAQLEDVARLQEKIASDTRAVQDDATNLPDARQAARLSQSKTDQLQNAQRLRDLAKQGEDTLREAVKNPLLPEEKIRDWTQTMQQWQQLSKEKMPQAAQAMETAAQDVKSATPQKPTAGGQSPNRSNPSDPSNSSPTSTEDQAEETKRRADDLADAAKRAEEIMEALRQMEQKANQHLDDLQAFTLAQRLRKVGVQELGLSALLTTNLADTIGLLPQELPDKFKRLNTAYVKEQGGAHDESAALESEISRFYERTQKTNYGNVSLEMKTNNTAEELDRMGGRIQSNIMVRTALDLTNWSGRFQSWADELQPKSPPSQGGSGQSGPPPPDLTKLLMALLRLREREMNLRDQTSALETSKSDPVNYKNQAAFLSGSQRELSGVLGKLRDGANIPALDAPFNQSSSDMAEVQKLLDKPRTDAVTDAGEVKVVDGLTDLINLINEQAQKARAQSKPGEEAGQTPSAEEMAYLMGLMKPGAQAGPPMQTPGGNTMGGTTSRAGRAVNGDVKGSGPDSRDVHRSGGSLENYPAEFRDALDNYFHGVEKPAGNN